MELFASLFCSAVERVREHFWGRSARIWQVSMQPQIKTLRCRSLRETCTVFVNFWREWRVPRRSLWWMFCANNQKWVFISSLDSSETSRPSSVDKVVRYFSGSLKSSILKFSHHFYANSASNLASDAFSRANQCFLIRLRIHSRLWEKTPSPISSTNTVIGKQWWMAEEKKVLLVLHIKYHIVRPFKRLFSMPSSFFCVLNHILKHVKN